VGGESFLRRLEPEFFERAFHPRHLLELSERNPEAALAWMQLLREVGGESFLRRLEPEFFERAFHPRHLLELSERNPEAALAWVRLLREMGGESFLRRLEPEFFERAFHPRYLLELSERNPEAALAWVQLLREMGGESFLRRLEPEFFERAFSPVVLDRLLRRKPAAFAVALRFARVFELAPAADAVLRSWTAFLRGPGTSTALLGNLPLSAIGDLQWLAARAHRRDLHALLVSLVGDLAYKKSSDETLDE
jgi:hypothetical protein